jgi:hypothetical protein
MPAEDLELAKAWAQNRKPKPKVNVAPKPVMETLVGDKKLLLKSDGEKVETAYAVRDRLQAQERTIAAEIQGLNAALEQARHANDEKSAYKLLQALKSARNEHRAQADSLLKAEGRIIILERTRGDLVSVSATKDFLSKILNPLTIWIRKLADAARNPDEKTLLENLREAGLAAIRVAATEALNFQREEPAK